MSARTHIPEHDPEACETCGGCTWSCPASVFSEQADEQDSLRGALFTTRPFPGKRVEKPPCTLACPLGQDVPGYIAAIAAGEVDRAARIVRETNALPAVCGRVCIASCARACTRAAIDEGLDIRGLKRFAVTAAAAAAPTTAAVPAEAKRVAVVGSGPAGLAAAHRLVQLGLRPVVFEANETAGGMLVSVIPEFVLPRAMVAGDVAALERMGVEIKTKTRVGTDFSWADLDTEYDAVLVATGAGQGRLPTWEGADRDGVSDVITFCASREPLLGPVVVEGGGDAALEAARLARRRGAHDVCIVHSAPRALWPAGARALEVAEEEGVTIVDEQRVIGCAGAGRLESVRLQKMVATRLDGVGRPIGSTADESTVPAAVFVATAWRRPARSAQPDLDGLDTERLGTLRLAADYRLPRTGWYAAGEAATGAATVVDSMATGRRAAETIARDLGEE